MYNIFFYLTFLEEYSTSETMDSIEEEKNSLQHKFQITKEYAMNLMQPKIEKNFKISIT